MNHTILSIIIIILTVLVFLFLLTSNIRENHKDSKINSIRPHIPSYGTIGYPSNWGGWGDREIPEINPIFPNYLDLKCSEDCIKTNTCECDCQLTEGHYKCAINQSSE